MLNIEMMYEKDLKGNRTDSLINSTMDLIAGQIVRQYDPPCPYNHPQYPSATIVLGIVNDKVDVVDVTEYCCESLRALLATNLRREIKFE